MERRMRVKSHGFIANYIEVLLKGDSAWKQ